MEQIDFAIILDRIGSSAALARLTGMTLGAAKQARRRSVIPSAYWFAIAQTGIATLDELARAGSKPGFNADLDISGDLPVGDTPVQPAQPAGLFAMGDRP